MPEFESKSDLSNTESGGEPHSSGSDAPSEGKPQAGFRGKKPPRDDEEKNVVIPNIVVTAILLESALVLLALLLAFVFDMYDPAQKLIEYREWDWQRVGIIGAVGTIPLLVAFLTIDVFRLPVFEDLLQVVDRILVPLFRGMAIWKLLLIALAAGIGEEFLFRWCIQGGITTWFASPQLGVFVGVLVSSVLFGICHWLTPAYAFLAFLASIYFGVMMFFSESFVATAICHAGYDLVALLYIAYFRR